MAPPGWNKAAQHFTTENMETGDSMKNTLVFGQDDNPGYKIYRDRLKKFVKEQCPDHRGQLQITQIEYFLNNYMGIERKENGDGFDSAKWDVYKLPPGADDEAVPITKWNDLTKIIKDRSRPFTKKKPSKRASKKAPPEAAPKKPPPEEASKKAPPEETSKKRKRAESAHFEDALSVLQQVTSVKELETQCCTGGFVKESYDELRKQFYQQGSPDFHGWAVALGMGEAAAVDMMYHMGVVFRCLVTIHTLWTSGTSGKEIVKQVTRTRFNNMLLITCEMRRAKTLYKCEKCWQAVGRKCCDWCSASIDDFLEELVMAEEFGQGGNIKKIFQPSWCTEHAASPAENENNTVKHSRQPSKQKASQSQVALQEASPSTDVNKKVLRPSPGAEHAASQPKDGSSVCNGDCQSSDGELLPAWLELEYVSDVPSPQDIFPDDLLQINPSQTPIPVEKR